jgi:hypothetical protein
MGGRGSSGGTRISGPADKRGPAGTRRKKIRVDKPGLPYGTERPGQPAKKEAKE